jgi:osmotically-inducible protein OsmY
MATMALPANMLYEIRLVNSLKGDATNRYVILATTALVNSAQRAVVQVIQPDGASLPLAEGADESADGKLTASTSVVIQGRAVGVVTRIWTTRDGQITHLLLHEPPRRFAFLRGTSPEYILTITEALTLSADGQILVDLPAKTIEALPIFRPDAAIETDVLLALEQALAVPQFIHAVSATVEDGFVHLSGFVDFRARKELAEAGVQAVPGVRGMTSDIIAEDELADRVDAALERALQRPECAGANVSVHIEHAIAMLTGEAPSNAARRALEEAAIAVPGVRVVVNQIRAAGRPVAVGAIATHNR